MDKSQLKQYIPQFNKQKIMVIGDLIADVYLEGKISRISREAPVLILREREQHTVPGGAANAVHNVQSLGGQVCMVGIIGRDADGEKLRHVLSECGIGVTGVFIDETRPTTTKTRIMAGGQATVKQQVVRIDRESDEKLAQQYENKIIQYIQDHWHNIDGVILSDYGYGVITPKVIQTVVELQSKAKKKVSVDSRYSLLSYQGVTIATPNEAEAGEVYGMEIVNKETLEYVGSKLLTDMNADAILVTRGGEGMTLFEKEGKITYIPVTNKHEVFDVTGAGDTVVACLTLALSAGAPSVEAAALSNYAAGLVVRKQGTATVSQQELAKVLGE
jgi:D-glycero-beta-D-manno-heptose-7-phosphate kinase